MRDKSKFIGFILSFVPGLSHLYIGLKERAFIFMGMLGLGFLASIVIGMFTYVDTGLSLFMVGYSLLWLIALLDLFAAWKVKSRYENSSYINGEDKNIFINQEEVLKNNKRTTTMAFSIVPGAGHMYLGYQNKGLYIMGAFFFSIFFMGWLGISLLLFLLPIIWFYSFFDALHLVDGTEDIINKEFNFSAIKTEWIGIGLISIGVIIILERILYPIIDYRIRRYIQTSIVSLIFIVAGILILKKNKESVSIDTDELDDMDEEDEIYED